MSLAGLFGEGLPQAVLDFPQFHSYCETVKNVTLSIDDKTWREARIAAAEQGKSLSALVREFLQSLRPVHDTHAENVRRMFDAMDRAHPKGAAANRLSRDEVHDRRRIR